MHSLVKLLVAISLLRAGPQDIPAATVLLAITLSVYLFTSILLALPGGTMGSAMAVAVIDAVLLAALPYACLALRGLKARFLQTYIALTGTGTLLGLAGAPLSWWLRPIEEGSAPALPSLLLLALLGWNITVMTHILRQALSAPALLGIACALMYLAALWTVAGYVLSAAA